LYLPKRRTQIKGFEKRVLKKILRTKKKKITVLKELSNKEPHNLYFLPSISGHPL
jgi:hypothetical protein